MSCRRSLVEVKIEGESKTRDKEYHSFGSNGLSRVALTW
jgi:hypothetical protein